MLNHTQNNEYTSPEITEYDFIDYTLGGQPVPGVESENTIATS